MDFEYVFLKLYDLWARDYFDTPNPVVKILLPKMRYDPEERWEVIRQAYIGLYQLASRTLFVKYTDFIDVYAEVDAAERDQILREMEDRKETVMIKQVLKEEGRKEGLVEGRMEGRTEGRTEGRMEGHINMLNLALMKKYQRSIDDMNMLKGLGPEDQLELMNLILDCDSFSEIEKWIRQRKSGNIA